MMQTGFLVNTWTMTKGQSLSDLLFTSSHFLTLRSGRTPQCLQQLRGETQVKLLRPNGVS